MNMYTERMKKVCADYIRNVLIPGAKNRGELAEAYTLLLFHCTAYNPYMSASEGGDMYGPVCGHLQVKCLDGRITIPGGATGNDLADFERAMEQDASPTWVIWHDKSGDPLKHYSVVSKEELLQAVRMDAERCIKVDKDQTGKDSIRLKLGMQKRKYFKDNRVFKGV